MMSTNHNRIKVSDLEKNQPDRILTTNSNGELEFTSLDEIKVDSYNALDYTQEGKSLDARQGKVLKDLIDKKIDKNFGTSQANKIIGTDSNGNLKFYPITNYPAPFLGEDLLPFLPNSSGNLIIMGAFFTPSMTVSIEGQTVNYITFVNDNLIKLNITTGSSEGIYDVTLNNGLSTTFPKALMIVLGDVIKPTEVDWTNKNDINLSQADYAKVTSLSVNATAKWIPPIDYTGNFRVSFKFTPSPLAPGKAGNSYFQLVDTLGNHIVGFRQIGNLYVYYGNNSTLAGNYAYDNTKKLEIRKVGSLITLHQDDGVLIFTLSNFITLTNNLWINLSLNNFDVSEIKYIKMA